MVLRYRRYLKNDVCLLEYRPKMITCHFLSVNGKRQEKVHFTEYLKKRKTSLIECAFLMLVAYVEIISEVKQKK